MKRWNWKEHRLNLLMTVLVVVFGACMVVLIVLVGIVPFQAHRSAEATWSKYQIDHKCALVADAETADLDRRTYKDKDGNIRAILLGASSEKAYVCADDIIYVTPL